MRFDFDAAVAAPFRMQPGLRRADAGLPWRTSNEIGSDRLAAKAEVLRRHATDALLAVPGFDATPVIEALCVGVPEALATGPGGRLTAPRLGVSVDGGQVEGSGSQEAAACLDAVPRPLRAAALTSLAFAEDFAVVDAGATVPWMSVCLPSRWSPAEKIGRPLAEIHAPVADGGLIVRASEALARLVTGGERWERFVWTITPSPSLDAHPARQAPCDWPATDGPGPAAFFRTEHQQFVPMTVAGRRQALFSIGVEVEPLARVTAVPGRARRLHDALASMSPEVLAYRGLANARRGLLAWLAARAG